MKMTKHQFYQLVFVSGWTTAAISQNINLNYYNPFCTLATNIATGSGYSVILVKEFYELGINVYLSEDYLRSIDMALAQFEHTYHAKFPKFNRIQKWVNRWQMATRSNSISPSEGGF